MLKTFSAAAFAFSVSGFASAGTITIEAAEYTLCAAVDYGMCSSPSWPEVPSSPLYSANVYDGGPSGDSYLDARAWADTEIRTLSNERYQLSYASQGGTELVSGPDTDELYIWEDAFWSIRVTKPTRYEFSYDFNLYAAGRLDASVYVFRPYYGGDGGISQQFDTSLKLNASGIVSPGRYVVGSSADLYGGAFFENDLSLKMQVIPLPASVLFLASGVGLLGLTRSRKLLGRAR